MTKCQAGSLNAGETQKTTSFAVHSNAVNSDKAWSMICTYGHPFLPLSSTCTSAWRVPRDSIVSLAVCQPNVSSHLLEDKNAKALPWCLCSICTVDDKVKCFECLKALIRVYIWITWITWIIRMDYGSIRMD